MPWCVRLNEGLGRSPGESREGAARQGFVLVRAEATSAEVSSFLPAALPCQARALLRARGGTNKLTDDRCFYRLGAEGAFLLPANYGPGA